MIIFSASADLVLTWYQQRQQKKEQNVKGTQIKSQTLVKHTSCFSWLLHVVFVWALPENMTKRCVVRGCCCVRETEQALGSRHGTTEVTKFFYQVDADGDGLLGRRDFLRTIQVPPKSPNDLLPALLDVEIQPLSSIISEGAL